MLNDWVKNGAFCVLACCCLVYALTVSAQSRRVVEYTYDDSGNIIEVFTEVNDAEPVVDSVVPGQARIGIQRNVVVTGTGLRNAQVTTEDPNIVISGLVTGSNELSFNLLAQEGTALIPHQIRVSTVLGDSSFSFDIFPVPPTLRVSPLPLRLISEPQTPITLSVTLSEPDVLDQTFDISISNTDLISSNVSQFTVAAGNLTPDENIELTGLQPGITNLQFAAQDPDFNPFRITVEVGEPLQLPEGLKEFASQSLQVIREGEVLPDLVSRGPFISSPLGVTVAQTDTPENVTQPVFSDPLQILFGAAYTSVSPESPLIAGVVSVPVVVSGQGLQNIDTVYFEPDNEQINFTNIVATADGSSVSFEASVLPNTELTQLRVVLSAGEEIVLPAASGIDRLRVGGGSPTLDSITPHVISRLSSPVITVVGENLRAVSELSIQPNQGISVPSAFSVNAEGTQLTQQLIVAEGASLGARLLTLSGPTGSTSAVLSPSNRLIVVNDPGVQVNGLSSPLLGINRLQAELPDTRNTRAYSAPLNLVKGSGIVNSTPGNIATGETATFTIQGFGLENVNQIAVVPSDDVLVEDIVADPSGESVAVTLSVAEEAEIGLRRFAVSALGENILGVSPLSGRFSITQPLPELASVTPNFLQNNGQPQQFILRGENLIEVDNVVVTPSDDITVSNISVGESGEEVFVTLTAATNTIIGERLIQLETPTAVTSNQLGATNRLFVIGEESGIFDSLTAPILGVQVGTTEPSVVSINSGIASAVLGVERSFTPPVTSSQQYAVSPPLGISVSPSPVTIEPNVVIINQANEITITGGDLSTVTSVSVTPSDGLTVASFELQNSNTISLPITVDADADLTLRRVVIETANGPLITNDPFDSRIRVVGNLPTIESIAPIQELPGTVFNMTIRGAELTSATRVRAMPDDSRIFFSPPSVNAAGTEATVGVFISEAATPGARTIVLTTQAGDTSVEQISANTFTVVVE